MYSKGNMGSKSRRRVCNKKNLKKGIIKLVKISGRSPYKLPQIDLRLGIKLKDRLTERGESSKSRGSNYPVGTAPQREY